MQNTPLCIKVSDAPVFCPVCKGIHVIKNGFTKTHKQQYRCKDCGKHFMETYTYHAYEKGVNAKIIVLTREGLGIRSTARALHISTTTLLRRLIAIAAGIKKPALPTGKTYEVDEIRSFLGNKNRLIWIVYALERSTKKVIDFNIGARTNKTLFRVIHTLELSKAKRIYTDKLKNYTFLINKRIHKTAIYQTNHIERNNLTIRTHLKRLNRKTICFSRSTLVLFAILQIYFWG